MWVGGEQQAQVARRMGWQAALVGGDPLLRAVVACGGARSLGSVSRGELDKEPSRLFLVFGPFRSNTDLTMRLSFPCILFETLPRHVEGGEAALQASGALAPGRAFTPRPALRAPREPGPGEVRRGRGTPGARGEEAGCSGSARVPAPKF